MSSPSRFAPRSLRSVLSASVLAGVLAACASASPDGAPEDGPDDGADAGGGAAASPPGSVDGAGAGADGGQGTMKDSSVIDGTVTDAAADAQNPTDAGDGGAPASDAGAASDASVDGAGPDGSTAADSGPSAACAAVLAGHLGSDLVPPYHFAGFDLSASAVDGGTTAITQLDPLGCYPAIAEDYAAEPGYRMHGPSGIQLFSNLDTDAVFLVQADTSFTGSMTFDTLASSSYGQHHYVAKIGSVTKDGVPFVIDWNAPDAAFEELYAGLMTTFAPDEVPATSCLAAGVCLENADRSVFGVRQPLHIYMTFVAGTSQPDQFYTVQTAAEATCLTPMSIDEQFAYAPIEPPEYSGIGTLTLADGNGNAYLNPSSANSALCSNGILGTKTDTGQTLSWADGRVVFTYDVEQGSLDYALGTKLATGPGYKGYLWADTADGNHEYDAALGSFTYDGANLDLLAGGDEAITGFANAIRATYFDDGTASTNCITDGTCILTADAQSGQTTLAMGLSGLAFVFSTANHELLEIDETTRN